MTARNRFIRSPGSFRVRVLLPALLLAAVAAPAAAEAVVHGTLTPLARTETVAPGEGRAFEYGWNVTFEGTACNPGTQVGIDFIVATGPRWASASFEPAGRVADAPHGQGATMLEVNVGSEAPAGSAVLALATALNGSGHCTPEPRLDARGANLTLLIEGAPAASTTPPRSSLASSHRTPGAGVAATGFVAAVVALRLGRSAPSEPARRRVFNPVPLRRSSSGPRGAARPSPWASSRRF